MINSVISTVVLILISGCSSGNLDYVKKHGPDRWREIGFEPVGYESFQWGLGGFSTYGGAHVWWRLRKADNNVSYTGYLQRWGDELHVYGPFATDAIKPH